MERRVGGESGGWSGRRAIGLRDVHVGIDGPAERSDGDASRSSAVGAGSELCGVWEWGSVTAIRADQLRCLDVRDLGEPAARSATGADESGSGVVGRGGRGLKAAPGEHVVA